MTSFLTNPDLFSITNDDVNKPITGLEDVRLVPTPVTYSRWVGGGREDRVEEQLRAELFEDVKSRDVTMIASNVYGDPFLKVGRLQVAIIKPRPAGGWDPWSLYISLVPPKKRNGDGYERDFPSSPVVLMRGRHDISLDGLPTLTTSMRWHCANFASTWREVASRCYAIAGPRVLIDTTEATVSALQKRLAERAAS
jgi:hypothetical protein